MHLLADFDVVVVGTVMHYMTVAVVATAVVVVVVVASFVIGIVLA